MNDKTKKFFSIFWLIVGIVWLALALKYWLAEDDLTGAVIYGITAIVSFILAFVYRKK